MEKILPLTVALLALGLFMIYVEVTEGKCWETTTFVVRWWVEIHEIHGVWIILRQQMIIMTCRQSILIHYVFIMELESGTLEIREFDFWVNLFSF